MKTKLFLTAVAVIALSAVHAMGAPILSLVGPPTSVAVGNAFTIDVRISGVADLASYQFDVGYDPLVVSGTSVQEGSFLPSAGSTLFVPGTIDNGSGTINFTAAALVGVGPGASGDGVLASFQFTALATGDANFALISPLLYNSIPDPIDVTTRGAFVTIDAVPEPITAWLVACGLGALGLIRRRT